MSVVITGLYFSYGDKNILSGIDLNVRGGEKVGIVGASGGGKSTLLKLVSGLYEVRTGAVAVTGETDSAGRRKNVAMVMQSAGLFPASIRDNITCGRETPEADVWRACGAARLKEWVDSLPDGLDTYVGERGGKVSGGQAQRIAIARAVLKDAPVVLLDEPTSALDGETGEAVVNALTQLAENKTVLHGSHRCETLAGCDRILELRGGKLYG